MVESNLTTRLRLWPPGYSLEYSLRTRLEPSGFVQFAADCLSDLVLKHSTERKFRNIKGIDYQNQFTRPVLRPNYPCFDEEVYFCSGELVPEDLAEESDKSNFQLRGYTRFKSFESASMIVYDLNETFFPDFSDSPQAILRQQDTQLQYLSVSLELFRSRFMGTLLGFAPVVSQGFIVESNGSDLSLKIFANTLKTRTSLPLDQFGYFASLNNIINSQTGVDLYRDFRDKL